MSIRRILGVLFASFVIASCPIADWSLNTANAHESDVTADLIVWGRIVDETSKPLPQKPGWVDLSSLWTYRIRVERVLHGKEQSEIILAQNIADPALRMDIDLIFYLVRKPDGTYEVTKLARA